MESRANKERKNNLLQCSFLKSHRNVRCMKEGGGRKKIGYAIGRPANFRLLCFLFPARLLSTSRSVSNGILKRQKHFESCRFYLIPAIALAR